MPIRTNSALQLDPLCSSVGRCRSISNTVGRAGAQVNQHQPLLHAILCASYVCTWYQPADHSMVPGTYVRKGLHPKKISMGGGVLCMNVPFFNTYPTL